MFEEEISAGVEPKLFLPYVDEALKAFSEFSREKLQRTEVLHDVLEQFFQDEIQNMQVYKTKDGAASLPYTSINITEFAKRMYKRYAGTAVEASKITQSSEPAKKKTVIFFTSFLATKSGHPFVFAELVMQQAVRALAPTIQAFQEGRVPKDVRVVTLGSPTNNRWGSISQQYAERIQKDAYTTLGNTYAELLESTGILSDHAGQDAIVLHGTSMGGSLAGRTAEKLLSDGVATQSQQERMEQNRPFLQVRMDSPAGVRREGHKWPRWKKLQTPLGFAGEVLKIAAKDHDTIKTALGEDKFLEGLQKETEKRGIPTMHDEQQEIRKQGVVKSLIDQLKSGVSLKPNIKVNLVTGLSDLLTKSRWDRVAKRKIRSYEGVSEPLGRNIIPGESPQRREVAIESGHLIPFFKRKSGNEMWAWARSIDKLIVLKNSSSANFIPIH
ncbi:MAG: hypothetical protein HYT11_02085 [Candidatus Levybacteria bacterium]|nr:hypothetical protein [Candidatus Levybacteria bacterium]